MSGPPAPAERPGPPADPESVARTLVLRRLTASARTRADLLAHLLGRGVPQEVADRVLDRFTVAGLVDDVQYARDFARSQMAYHGQSRRAVEYKLRQRGVAGDDIEVALADLDADDDLAAAVDLLRKRSRRWVELDHRVRRERQLGLLARRGYSMPVAREAVTRWECGPG